MLLGVFVLGFYFHFNAIANVQPVTMLQTTSSIRFEPGNPAKP